MTKGFTAVDATFLQLVTVSSANMTQLHGKDLIIEVGAKVVSDLTFHLTFSTKGGLLKLTADSLVDMLATAKKSCTLMKALGYKSLLDGSARNQKRAVSATTLDWLTIVAFTWPGVALSFAQTTAAQFLATRIVANGHWVGTFRSIDV